MSTEETASELKTKALEAIELLATVIDDIEQRMNSVDDVDAKRAQLKEISRSIEQLENKNIAVPDVLRHLKTTLVTELTAADEPRDVMLEIGKALTEIFRPMEGLGLTSRTKPKRSRRGSSAPITSDSVLRQLIIDALLSYGGRARSRDVLKWIEGKLEGQFTPRDLETRMDGRTLVWKNNVQWQRAIMVREGVLRSDSPTGIWELNE
ncbi:hypothetical protein J7M28_06565 [bacterium]|nr:hypothetical protein [bacterium]